MAVALSQVRVEAALDASEYVAGARAKVAADEAMIGSGKKVAEQQDVTDRRLGTSSSALDKFIQRNDAAYRATVQFERGLAQLNRGLGVSIGPETYNRQLELLTNNYKANLVAAQRQEQQLKSGGAAFGGVAAQSTVLGGAITKVTEAFAGNRGAYLSLQAAGVNAFQALASGMSAWRVAQTEGAQVLGAFAQTGAISFRTIAGWGGIIGGVAAAVAVLGSRFATIQGGLREFGVALDTVGRNQNTTATALEQTAENASKLGVPLGQAQELIIGGLRSYAPLIEGLGQNSERLLRVAQNATAVTGRNLKEEYEALTRAISQGVPGITKYAVEVGALSHAQAGARQFAAEHGEANKQLKQTFEDIDNTLDGQHKRSLTAFGTVTESVGIVWNKFITDLAHIPEQQATDDLSTRIRKFSEDVPGYYETAKRTTVEFFHDLMTALKPAEDEFLKFEKSLQEAGRLTGEWLGTAPKEGPSIVERLGFGKDKVDPSVIFTNTKRELDDLVSYIEQKANQITGFDLIGKLGLDKPVPAIDFNSTIAEIQHIVDLAKQATTAISDAWSKPVSAIDFSATVTAIQHLVDFAKQAATEISDAWSSVINLFPKGAEAATDAARKAQEDLGNALRERGAAQDDIQGTINPPRFQKQSYGGPDTLLPSGASGARLTLAVDNTVIQENTRVVSEDTRRTVDLTSAAEALVSPINRLSDTIEGMPQALGAALATAFPAGRQLQSGGDPVIRPGAGAAGGDILEKIAQYESSNQNILQQLVPFAKSDASGFWQILSKTWNSQIAPGTGLPTVERGGVMNLPYETQRQGAQYLYNTQGIAPWAGNQALMSVLGGGSGGSGYRLASQQTTVAATSNIYGGLDPKLIVGAIPSAGAGLPDINTIGTPRTGYGNKYIFPGGNVPAGAGTVSGASPALSVNQTNEQVAAQKRAEQAERDATAVKQQFGAAAELAAKKLELERQAVALGLKDKESDSYVTQQLAEYTRGLGAAATTATDQIRRQADGQAAIAQGARQQSAEIIRLTEVERARLQVQQHTGDVDKLAAASLALRANQTLVAADAQSASIDRQVEGAGRLAEASARGTAAVKQAEIENQALASTYGAVDAAQAAYNQAVIAGDEVLKASTAATLEKAKALEGERAAKLKANEAYAETTRANLQAEQIGQQNEALRLQISLQGQSSDEVQRQLINLRAAQDIQTKYAAATPEAKENYIAANAALAETVVKLGEARAAQERWNEEIQSIAETVNTTLTSAFDDLFSGKKITDWGERLKSMLREIASTVVQTELIKPLVGSLLSGASPQLAQQYGTLGGGGGLLGNVFSGLGGASKLVGSGGESGSGLLGGLFSGGGSLLGGGGVALTPAAVGTEFFLPGTSTALGAVGGETLGLSAAAGGATSALGGIGSVLGTIGGVLGPLALVGSLVGGLFGNKKPSNNAGGLLYDLSSTQVSNVQGGTNAGVAKQIGDSLATFSKELLKQLPGATLPTGAVNVVKGDLTGITTEYSGPLGNIKASFATAQEAVTNFSVAIAQNLGNVSDTVKQVLSTITDPGQIQAALASAKAYDDVETAYDNVFQNIAADSVRRIGPFETILNQITDQFDTLTKSAVQYGLALDPINEGYQKARDRLAEDYNETIRRSATQLKNPAQAAVDEEKRAGDQRVQDAKVVGADLVAVAEYNAAALKAATDAQTKAIADFTESIRTSFNSALSGIIDKVGPFEAAFNAINDNLTKLTEQAVAAGRSTDDIASAASGSRQQLMLYFNENIRQLTQAITDPVQRVIEIENQAGQQRVRDAVTVNGDLAAVAKYNTASLERVTVAAKAAVDNLASAQQLAASASSVLAASIASITGTGKGPYAQALDILRQQVDALIEAARKSDPLTDVAAFLNAFSASFLDLRHSFDANIKNLTTALTDPFQAALDIELEAGRRRVQDAQAVGADLNLVDEYNRQNLLAVAKAAASATEVIATAAGFNRDIAQQITAIRDPLAAALQAELEAGEKRVAAAQQIGADLARVDELNCLKLLQMVEATNDGADALDKFTNRLQSLQSALAQLTAGPLSGLTPAQQVSAGSANFERLLAQVQGGNRDLIPELATAGTQAVQASQSVYGNAKQTADLRARVTKALQDVAADTGREASLTAQSITITATNQAQVKAALQAQATAARSIADNAAAQADAEFKRTGVQNQSLRDQATAANTIAVQLEAQVVAVTAQTSVQNRIVATLQEQLSTQAAAARAIANQLQAQADIEFRRTGIRNNIYQMEADGARQIAYFLDLQANAQNLSASALTAQANQQQAQANIEAARTGVVSNVYQQQADFSRVLAYLLNLQANSQSLSAEELRQQATQHQAQADIEAAKTGVVYNAYQQQADAANQLAYYLQQSGLQQTSQITALGLAARHASAIADTLQAQADQDYQRTGIKNTLLQDEVDAARQIAANLDKQATSQGQLSQADASRVQIAVALLQQDAAVAARTAQQNAGQATVSTANVGTPEQQAQYVAAAQQQAAGVAARIAAEQQSAAQAEQNRAAYEAAQQAQQERDQANYQLILQQQAAAQRLQQFIGGDRQIGVMLAELVRYGTIVQDYFSQPYLARDWQFQEAAPFIQGWNANVPFSLSDMLAAQGFATGTASAPPGWAVVGERGPEFVKLRGGETILPHGVRPPRPANDNAVAELRRLQHMITGLIRETRGATFSQQSDVSQTSHINVVNLAAQPVAAIADTPQTQADWDHRRGSIKNTLLRDEANVSRQISASLDKQATSHGQLSQTDVGRVQIAVALLRQDVTVAARTAQQNQGAAPVSVANVRVQHQQAARALVAQQQAARAPAAQQQVARDAVAHQQAARAPTVQQQAAPNAAAPVALLAELVRFGRIVHDYFSQPHLAHDRQRQEAIPLIQGSNASVPFALSDMLAAQGFATGTGSAPPGWAIVGERGPEFMKLRGGEAILPHGVPPPQPANDDVVAELRRLQDMISGLIRQTQGGQQIANRDAKMIAGETAAVGRRLAMVPPMRRNVG